MKSFSWRLVGKILISTSILQFATWIPKRPSCSLTEPLWQQRGGIDLVCRLCSLSSNELKTDLVELEHVCRLCVSDLLTCDKVVNPDDLSPWKLLRTILTLEEFVNALGKKCASWTCALSITGNGQQNIPFLLSWPS